MTNFDHLFKPLPLEAKVRLAHYAKSKGYILTSVEEEVEGQPLIPLEVLKAEEITRSYFPNIDDPTYDAVKSFYQSLENTGFGVEYPPLGYTPSMSQKEKDAASFLSFMMAFDEKFGDEEEPRYPIRRLQPETVSEEKVSFASSLIQSLKRLF